MGGIDAWELVQFPVLLLRYIVHVTGEVLLSPSSAFSLASLICALAIAALFLVLRNRRPLRIRRLRALLRALFPMKWMFSRSSQTDVMLFVLNSFVFGIIIGQAIISYSFVSTWATASLTAVLGQMAPTELPWYITGTLLTIALFLAYEFGYWLDHYLSHKVPFLWEFHKVHHSAEVLTPLTNARVHPVDSLMLLNILAVAMGLTHGIMSYAFGRSIEQFTIADSNVLIVIFTYLVAHLQHTHLWISFTGNLGKLLLSPAHHQIHHSMRPEHYDRNFGACLAIWDWLFGTLCVPAAKREELRFGVDDIEGDPHSVDESLAAPVRRAAGHLAPTEIAANFARLSRSQ